MGLLDPGCDLPVKFDNSQVWLLVTFYLMSFVYFNVLVKHYLLSHLYQSIVIFKRRLHGSFYGYSNRKVLFFKK